MFNLKIINVIHTMIGVFTKRLLEKEIVMILSKNYQSIVIELRKIHRFIFEKNYFLEVLLNEK